ncbi:MAG TPA: ABC transporter permease, partial [Candidatus Acidoferrum sp.]
MNWLAKFARRIRMLIHRQQFDADLEEEMRLHLELRQEEQIESGMSAYDAQTVARRRFGNTTYLEEESHIAWGWEWFENLAQDVRYGLRSLRRSPGFTAIAVLILGLGIGATTTIFSVVNAVILRPQPYFDPSRLVAIEGLYQPAGKPARVVAAVVADDVTEWRRQSRAMENMVAFSQTDLPARAQNGAFSPVIDLVDPQFLDTLGVLPMLGHDFETRDPNVAEPSVIITRKFWQQAFSGDPGVVGKTVNLDGSDMTVIGVLPPTFQTPRSDASFFDRDADLIMLSKSLESFPRRFRGWIAVGRLRPGVTIAQAQSEMQAIA